jgi:bacteriocin biosynthesis cyclodehydratase domain-containing protein
MPTFDRFLPRIQSLPSHLRLRPGYVAVEEQPRQFLLHSGAHSFKIGLPFPGISLLDFFEQLTGKRPLSDILEALPPFHVNFLLDITETLYQSGLLVPGLNGSAGATPRYIASARLLDQFRQLTAGTALKPFVAEPVWQGRLSQARVGLIGLGRIGSQLARLLTIVGVRNITGADGGLVDEKLSYTDAWYFAEDQEERRTEALERNLRALNGETRFSSADASLDDLEKDCFPTELLETDIVVVAADRFRPRLYESINRACVQASIPWTSYRPNWSGLTIEIGPTVLPKETACYECYQHRRRNNLARPENDDALALEGQKLPSLDIQITPCLSLFCYEVLRLLSGEVQPLTLGAIMEFDIRKGELVRRPLLKVPRCPVCRRDIQPFTPARFWSEIRTNGNDTTAVISEPQTKSNLA